MACKNLYLCTKLLPADARAYFKKHKIMYIPKHIEISHAPSQLKTSSGKEGAADQLAKSLENPPLYNNETIENMRNNPLHERIDKIDKIGKAQKKLAESAEILSKSKFVREANRKLIHPQKPN